MQSITFQNVWNLLNKYSFNFDDSKTDSLKCVICDEILINAKQSSCGCRFCLGCLKSYLENDSSSCPGNQEDCSQTILSESDTLDDNFANREISQLVVKCPFDLCSFEDSLKNFTNHLESCHEDQIRDNNENESLNIFEENAICEFCGCEFSEKEIEMSHHNLEDENLCEKYSGFCPFGCENTEEIPLKSHFRVCPNKPVVCPYSSMGCSAHDILPDEMNDHLYQGGLEHTKLFLEVITNLSDELENNKNELKIKCNEMSVLNENIIKLEDNYRQLLDENISMKHNYDILMTQFNGMKTVIEDLKRNGRNEYSNNNNNGASGADYDWKTVIDKHESDISDIQRSLHQQDFKYEKKYTEHIWKIENYSQIVEDARNNPDKRTVFSKHFFTSRNGYKIRLQFTPFNNVSRSVSLYLQLMRSRFDDILEWPFKYDVTLSILDQVGNNHNSLHLFYDPTDDEQMKAYAKPNNELNVCFGFSNFISRQTLNSQQFVLNNSLFIKFTCKPIILGE